MFYPAKIDTLEHMTDDSVNIRLTVDSTVRSLFSYVAGQYLVIRIPDHDPKEHRSYSISASPSENILQIGVKKMEGGNISTYLCDQAKVGDLIEVMLPQGTFTIPPEAKPHHIVAFAAGSGITPIMAIIKDLLSSHTDIRITLLYGNKDTQSVMYRQSLQELTDQYVKQLDTIYIYSQQKTGLADLEGRISPDKIKRWSEYLFSLKDTDTYLICGPGSMVADTEKYLLNEGISQNNILTELFTSPVEVPVKIQEELPSVIDDFAIKLKYERKWYTLNSGSNNTVILDLGLKAGIDLPYSCKSGVCSTCQARLISGEVRMDNNYVLSDSELAQGFILTCQSHALTAVVEIDYDMK